MICIKCKRKIDHSYGAPQLAGCYCLPCAINNGLTAEQIYAQQVRADTVREMQSAIKKYYSSSIYRPTQKHPTKHTMIEHLFYVIDQIAEEMIGETK